MSDAKRHAPSPGYNYSVNGLRGLSVLMVFGYHVANSGLPPVMDGTAAAWLAYAASSLRCGVELFFMISGYVIVKSLRRHATVGSFLKDRALRIFPAWLPVHLAICLAGPLVQWRAFAGGDLLDWLTLFLANLFFLPPLLPFTVTHPASWSITYEWVFYFAASSLVLAAGVRAPRRAAVVLWACLAAAFVMSFPRAVFFIPGVMVALAEPWLRRHATALRYPGLAIVAFLLLWQSTGSIATFSSPMWEWVADLRAVALVLSFATAVYLFAGICFGQGRIAGALHTRFFQHMGNVSYSFYLWHPVVMFAVKKAVVATVLPVAGHLVATAVFAVVAFVLSAIVSVASYRWVEQRATRLLRGWLAERRRPPLVPDLARPAGNGD